MSTGGKPMTIPKLVTPPTRLQASHKPYKILLYGDFGRRKTTFGGTCPRPLFVDTNGGLDTLLLQGLSPLAFTPTGYRDLEALFFWAKEHSDEFDSIVIDKIDDLVMLLMQEVSDERASDKAPSGVFPSLRSQFLAEQGDYYASQRQVRSFLVAMERLGKHIVLLSSLRTDDKGRNGPNISAGMEKVVCDFVSLVGEMVIIDEVTADDAAADTTGELRAGMTSVGVMFTTESNRRATKSRYRSLPPYIIDPTFDKLDQMIRASIDTLQSKPNQKEGK